MILEAVRQGMVAHVVFACNLRVFRTPNLGRDIEVLHGLTLKPRGPSQLLRKINHLFKLKFLTVLFGNLNEFTKTYWKLIKTYDSLLPEGMIHYPTVYYKEKSCN